MLSHLLQNKYHKQELDDKNMRILLMQHNVREKTTLITHKICQMSQITRKTKFAKIPEDTDLICIRRKNCEGGITFI